MAKAPKLDPKLCTRCRGTGYRATTVEYYGVPGLCWDCEGNGTREKQDENKAKRKAAKIRQDQFAAVQAMLWEIRNKNGGVKFPPRERRRAVFDFTENFTTHDYASKVGLTPKEAWMELCLSTYVTPVLDEAGKPVAWTTA